MNEETLERHHKELKEKGWSFGVPFFKCLSGIEEHVGDKGGVRIGGRAETMGEAEVLCVEAVLRYEAAQQPKFSFLNDPVKLIFQAAEELFPDIEFDIQYDDTMVMEKNEFGCTTFSEDALKPLIEINPGLTVMEQLEIIAHEIAHVKAGVGAEHNEVWEQHFQEMHDKSHELFEQHLAEYHEKEVGTEA
jgi:hypothetical protein